VLHLALTAYLFLANPQLDLVKGHPRGEDVHRRIQLERESSSAQISHLPDRWRREQLGGQAHRHRLTSGKLVSGRASLLDLLDRYREAQTQRRARHHRAVEAVDAAADLEPSAHHFVLGKGMSAWRDGELDGSASHLARRAVDSQPAVVERLQQNATASQSAAKESSAPGPVADRHRALGTATVS